VTCTGLSDRPASFCGGFLTCALHCTGENPLSAEIRIERNDILVGDFIGSLSVSPKLCDGAQASHRSSVHAPAIPDHQPLPFAVCLDLPSLPLPDIADLLF
jgi:hypothetical protein